jgi:hypothetical protein
MDDEKILNSLSKDKLLTLRMAIEAGRHGINEAYMLVEEAFLGIQKIYEAKIRELTYRINKEDEIEK